MHRQFNAHQMDIDQMDIDLKNITLFSICVYIVGFSVFESAQNSLSSIASYTLYAGIIIGLLYLIVENDVFISRGFILIAIFFALIAVSSLYSPCSSTIKSAYITRFLKTLPLLLIIGNVVTDEADIHKIIYAFIIAGAGTAIYAYASYGFVNIILNASRIDNMLGNQNTLGLKCAYGVIFTTYELLFNSLEKKNRILLFVLAVISIPAILFSGSRKALLVVVVSVLTLFLLNRRTRRSSIIDFPIVMLIGGALFYLIINASSLAFLKERISSFFEVFKDNGNISASDANRIYFIQDGFKRFLDSPVWGNGFLSSYYFYETYTHNNYIELLLDLGIIGFLYYYSMFAIIIYECKNMITDRRLSAFIIMFCVLCLTVDIGVVSFYDRSTLILIMSVLTIVDRQIGLRDAVNEKE